MYCDVNEAYDMKLIQNDCVYDEAVEMFHPKNMFSAQGELQDYEDMLKEYPNGMSGTPIEMIRKQTQPLELPIDNLEQQVPEQPACPLQEPTRVCTSPVINKVEKKEPMEEKKKEPFIGNIRNKVSQIAFDSIERNTTNKNKDETYLDFLTVGLKETAFLTLIGLIIIFLLDILIRLGKKL